MSSETLEQTFNVESPARLKLSNVRGSVEIFPGASGTLLVTASKHSENGDASNTRIEMRQAEDGTVIVETRYQDAWWAFFNFSKPCKVDYRVQIPPDCEVDASCISSSLSVRDLNGKFKLSTVSGGINLVNLNGEIKVSAVSGEISGSKLRGALHLNTVSGEVRLVESALSPADLTTVSGEIRLQTALTDGPYRFHSVSGSVWLSVPADTRCSLELQSVSGRIYVRLPVTSQKTGGGHFSCEVQGGGVKVFANSVSGSLYVETSESTTQAAFSTEREAESSTPPKPPTAPDTSGFGGRNDPVLDRETILDRIESGEMTVEEGLKALEKLL